MIRLTPSRIPWDEYLATHLREAVIAVVILVLLLVGLLFVEIPGGSALTGNVTASGKPVVFGTITVLASDNRTYTAPIRPDGTYVIKNIPPGPVQVAVSSPNPRPSFAPPSAPAQADPGDGGRRPASGQRGNGGGPAGTKSATKEVGVSIAAKSATPLPQPSDAVATLAQRDQHAGWFRIPGRYASPVTSGIRKEIKRGRTALNLSLD